MPNKKQYTAEEKAVYNEKKKAEIDELVTRIDNGVKAVFESEKYKEYLKFASKFTDYSARNTMLINVQKPEATLVAAYGKWKQLGRQVEKGESGISILAPVSYKTNQILETQKTATDEYGNKLYNADGTEKTETVESPIKGIAFKKVYVFDVSQTAGKEIPEPVTELKGDIDSARKEAVFAALKKVTGAEIEFKDIKGGAKGYYRASENQIAIKSGMSDAQTLKTAFHEVAHNLLHGPQKNVVTAKSPRNEKEVQAESVAFIVAERFGMDTSEYSFPYIASWSDGKQLEQLKNALQEIQAAAKKISAEIESELLKLQKRGLTLDEKLADTEINNVQKAEFLIGDCSDRGVEFSKDDTEKITDFASNHADISETVQLVSDMEVIQKQRDNYGYDFSYMNPIDTTEKALEAFDKGEAVYLLYPDNTEGMAENRAEIEDFDGLFGIEKEGANINREQNTELVPVSKAVALEMWDKDLDVFIDGEYAESRENIENVPDTAKLYVSEFQYSAQLDFERTKVSNMEKTNPNVIGNTPYKELGEKSELQYFAKLNNRHASNIAKQLDADGVKFSGLKKGDTTTITINKADVSAYESAVETVKQSYSKNKANAAKKDSKPSQEPVPKAENASKPVPVNDERKAKFEEKKKDEQCVQAIDKAVSDSNYEMYRYDLKTAATSVIDGFGAERVGKVLAEYINRHDYDGRISAKNKEWAKNFEVSDNKYPPVFRTHPTVLDGFINHAQAKIQELEKGQDNPNLSAYYDDKFLLSTERVELRDDHRGIPETKYFTSSVNEYFVDDVGWLDSQSYDREQKFSDLSARDFYAKVSQVNANYVDIDGKTGMADMTKQDYDLLTEKTYSPEDAVAFESAKAKLDEHKKEAGITENPTEYYAVRQMRERKFAVCTISADGLVTAVKPNISTIAEAKKAMIEIFDSKKDSVRCEFVHPQTLDEKSAELFKNQSNELPAVSYRIQLSDDKNAVDTHYLQKYLKNADDTYKIGEVVAKGNYEDCNKVLADILEHGEVKALGKDKSEIKTSVDFEIYQLKSTPETKGIRFEPFARIAEQGLKPDFANYDKVYEGSNSMLSVSDNSTPNRLEAVYAKFNNEHPDDFRGHSLSVSDVVVMDDKPYYVDRVGFQPLQEFVPLEVRQEKFNGDLPEMIDTLNETPNDEVLYDIPRRALNLKIPPEVMREACDMVDNDSINSISDSYEKDFAMKKQVDVEKPKQTPQKKPKL